MKPLYIAITALTIVVIGTVAFLAIDGTEQGVDPTGDTESGDPFLVTTFQTNVSLKDAGVASFVDVPLEREAYAGSVVKTSATGRALLESSNDITTIVDRNTELMITAHDESGDTTTIELAAGKLWSRIEKTFEHGEFFEVRTKNAVAVVRGTAFGVEYINAITQILVGIDAVEIFVRDEETGEALLETRVVVPAGKKAVVQDGKISVVDIEDNDRNSDWHIFIARVNAGTIMPLRDTVRDIKIDTVPADTAPEPTSETGSEAPSEPVAAPVTEPVTTIEMLVIRGQYFPLDQFSRAGAERAGCPSEHYHTLATDDLAHGLDGKDSAIVIDLQDPNPGSCGFGEIAKTATETIPLTEEQETALAKKLP